MLDFFAWVFSSMQGLLSSIGLADKQAKLVICGLDAAGKTSLLYTLKEDARMTATEPTRYPTSEQLKIAGVDFNTHDVGGHQQVRHLWKNYFWGTDAILFILDAADRGRLKVVQEEINNLLADKNIEDVPIAILCNKIDLPQAMLEDEIKQALKLEGQTTGKGSMPRSKLQSRPLELFMCTVQHKTGYGDAFRWIAQYV